MGILTPEIGDWFRLGEVSISDNEDLDWIISKRIELRRNKDWVTADKIRDEIVGLGVVVADSKESSSAYIESDFLVRQLMSDINSAFREDSDMFDRAVERAKTAGISNPVEDGKPRAWSGRERERVMPFIKQSLRKIRKDLEALK